MDPKDVGELQKALNDAAGKASVLWTTFIIFQLYLAIAFGSVTHRDLFLETPIKLPLLNVDLPLVGFFAVASTLLLILHFYVFLQLLGLASKAKNYNTLLANVPDESDRQYIRQRLDVFPILQFLAGPKDQRTGFVGFSLRLIAWITLVATPLLILLQGQVTFLPYHHEWIVWLQRITVLIDLAMVWYFWVRLRSDTDAIGWLSRKAKMYLGGAGTLCVVIFSIYLATFPGEWLKTQLPELRYIPTTWRPHKDDWTSLQALLFEGAVDYASRRPLSVFSNRLVLPGLDIIEQPKFDSEAKIAALPQTVSLRARHLEGAVLIGANLRKADFTAARLRGASLANADLRGARLQCAIDQNACVDLREAWLNNAQLQGASLESAQLQGASLADAQLQGASLDNVLLHGAWLNRAQLQGVSLAYARLQGASLADAQLQGASLDNALLHGAKLDRAQLQGASLNGTQLQGASLDLTQLQGSSLESAQLQVTHVLYVFAWRAPIQDANATNARIIKPVTRPDGECFHPDQACNWSARSFEALKHLIEDQVPEGKNRRAALARIDERLDPTKDFKREHDIAKAWADLTVDETDGLAYDLHEKLVAEQWREIGCVAEGAPYVTQGLIRNFQVRLQFGGREMRALAAVFFDAAQCAGARHLSEWDKFMLLFIMRSHDTLLSPSE
jgi:uncharacterized protein YjbI with pentapeptide repeats